jgi:hypothetical protein
LSSEKGEAVVITPPIVNYSDEIQKTAASELQKIGEPCPRDVVVRECSAIARLVIDYGDLRRKIRAAKDEK